MFLTLHVRQTNVSKTPSSFVFQENILWFRVAMNYAVLGTRVQAIHADGHVRCNFQLSFLSQASAWFKN